MANCKIYRKLLQINAVGQKKVSTLYILIAKLFMEKTDLDIRL